MQGHASRRVDTLGKPSGTHQRCSGWHGSQYGLHSLQLPVIDGGIQRQPALIVFLGNRVRSGGQDGRDAVCTPQLEGDVYEELRAVGRQRVGSSCIKYHGGCLGVWLQQLGKQALKDVRA